MVQTSWTQGPVLAYSVKLCQSCKKLGHFIQPSHIVRKGNLRVSAVSCHGPTGREWMYLGTPAAFFSLIHLDSSVELFLSLSTLMCRVKQTSTAIYVSGLITSKNFTLTVAGTKSGFPTYLPGKEACGTKTYIQCIFIPNTECSNVSVRFQCALAASISKVVHSSLRLAASIQVLVWSLDSFHFFQYHFLCGGKSCWFISSLL